MSLGAPVAVATGPVVPTDARAALLGALQTVPGLVVSATVPESPTEGSAWPVWIQTTFDGVLSQPGRPTYDVYVLLPAGHPVTTVETADGLLGQVCSALWDLCVITLAEPVSVRFETSTTMPGLRLRVIIRKASA